MSAPVVREAWGAVGSPVSTVRNLRAQRPISAPAGECKPKVRKKKLVLGSPKWWARLEAKAEAEIQRKQAIAEEQACADRLNKEVSEDCRNLIAVWWLKRARLSLHFWKRYQYDYYGYGHGMEGELGQGQWTDWCERLATEDGLHSLPHVPSASQVDRTRSLDEDDAEKRRQMREWYNQHTDFDWSSWHVWDVGPSTLNSTAGVDDTVYASTSYDNGYYTELFSSDYGGDFSGPESHISDLESFSSYTLDDFEPAATRYLTDTPQGLSRRGGRPAAAFQEYTASDESEISFKVGDVVMVTRLDSSGWWRGYVYGAEVRYVGWFPCTYISWLAPGRAALYTPDPTLDDSSSNDGFTSERGSTTSGDDYVIRGDSKRSDYGRFLPLLPEGLTPRDRHFRESATAQRLPLVVEEAEGEDEYDYDHEPADVEPRVISSYPARVSDTTFPDASGFVYDSDWMPASDAYDSYRSLVSDSEAAATHDAQLGLWKWNPSTDMWEMSRAGGVVVAEADPFTLSHDSSQLPVMATTTSAYAAADDQELALEVNDSVEVLEEDFSGWWRGRNTRTGQEGWFPCAYVAKME